ncbi:hypothetical protein H2248_001997 [Termitomyces sp. 'cryptogamus']|nr:hypothetical protein H2248_001997 [Termitomyces sp. 'cryptogamus']
MPIIVHKNDDSALSPASTASNDSGADEAGSESSPSHAALRMTSSSFKLSTWLVTSQFGRQSHDAENASISSSKRGDYGCKVRKMRLAWSISLLFETSMSVYNAK